MARDEEIIEILVSEDEDFKALVDNHRELDKSIQQLDSKIYLLPQEKMERKNLSKMKLAKKDRIAKVISDYRKKRN
jgi:uncharacterized protein YdcH (DUF465 family)